MMKSFWPLVGAADELCRFCVCLGAVGCGLALARSGYSPVLCHPYSPGVSCHPYSPGVSCHPYSPGMPPICCGLFEPAAVVRGY